MFENVAKAFSRPLFCYIQESAVVASDALSFPSEGVTVDHSSFKSHLIGLRI